jgi:hypothetical protein
MIPAAKEDGPLLRMELWVLDIITKFPPPKPFDGVTNTVAAATMKLHNLKRRKQSLRSGIAQAEFGRNWYRNTN